MQGTQILFWPRTYPDLQFMHEAVLIDEQFAHPGSQTAALTTLFMISGTNPELGWKVKHAPVESHVWQLGTKHA